MTCQRFAGLIATSLLAPLVAGRAEPLPERMGQPPAPPLTRPDFSVFAAAVTRGDSTTVVQLLDGNAEWIQAPIGEDGWTALEIKNLDQLRAGHEKLSRTAIPGDRVEPPVE